MTRQEIEACLDTLAMGIQSRLQQITRERAELRAHQAEIEELRERINGLDLAAEQFAAAESARSFDARSFVRELTYTRNGNGKR